MYFPRGAWYKPGRIGIIVVYIYCLCGAVITIGWVNLLHRYYYNGIQCSLGLPTVKCCAHEFFLSSGYFGDLIRELTDKSATLHIRRLSCSGHRHFSRTNPPSQRPPIASTSSIPSTSLVSSKALRPHASPVPVSLVSDGVYPQEALFFLFVLSSSCSLFLKN